MRWFITLLACLSFGQTTDAQSFSADSRPIVLPDTLQAYVGPDQRSYLYFFITGRNNLEQVVRLFDLESDGVRYLRRIGESEAGDFKGIVLVPFSTDRLEQKPTGGANWVPVVYVVRPRETVFRIARRYFDMEADDLLTLNNLSSTALRSGQRLAIGWIAARPGFSGTPAPTLTAEGSTGGEDYFAHRTTAESYGVAMWDKTSESQDTQLLAMHRTARLGTYVEVTNPMFGRSVMAKVVGRIPQTHRDDISIILSPAVAHELYALDARFRVRLRYIE